MSSVRCARVVFSAIMTCAAIGFAQEPSSPNRPDRFLLSLKPGDRLSWSINPDLKGYRLTLYSESRYAEIAKERIARQEEIKMLETDSNAKSQNLNFKDFTSKDPDVQRRVQNMRRLELLRTSARSSSELGTVAFVGQDYIAVVPADEEPRELLIPAWSIAQIGRSKETK